MCLRGYFLPQSVLRNLITSSRLQDQDGGLGLEVFRSYWQPPPADGQHEGHELSLQEGSALLEEAELDDLNGDLLCKAKTVFYKQRCMNHKPDTAASRVTHP